MRMFAVWLAALLWGCGGGLGVGGTGSSGFDEQFVISAVLVEGTCQDAEGTEYCPTNVDDPSGGGRTVDATLPDGDAVDCTAASASVAAARAASAIIDGTVSADACNFGVPVMPDGFEPGVVIRVAVRITGGDDNWQISDVVHDGTDPEFTAEIQVDPPADVPSTGEFDVQIAILTFESGVAEPPAEVEHLNESGASTVYVTREVTILTDPEPSPDSSQTPTPAPTPSQEPTAAPTPTEARATPTPAATALPATPTPARTSTPATSTPVSTRVPATPTPARATTTPRPADTPRATTTARPVDTARPTAAPEPSATPRPMDARPTPTPDIRPAPTVVIDRTPRPTDPPDPTATRRPVFTDPRREPTADGDTPPRVSGG